MLKHVARDAEMVHLVELRGPQFLRLSEVEAVLAAFSVWQLSTAPRAETLHPHSVAELHIR